MTNPIQIQVETQDPKTMSKHLTILTFLLVGDAFNGTPASENQYGRAFSAQDIAHDGCTPKCRIGDLVFKSCSYRVQSGWWFNACGLANLNGKYYAPPNHLYQASFLSWPTWRFFESLKSTTMSVICN